MKSTAFTLFFDQLETVTKSSATDRALSLQIATKNGFLSTINKTSFKYPNRLRRNLSHKCPIKSRRSTVLDF